MVTGAILKLEFSFHQSLYLGCDAMRLRVFSINFDSTNTNVASIRQEDGGRGKIKEKKNKRTGCGENISRG